MSGQTIRDVVIKLAVDVSKAKSQMDDLTRSVDQHAKAMDGAISKWEGLSASIRAGSSGTSITPPSYAPLPPGMSPPPYSPGYPAAQAKPAQDVQRYRDEMFHRNAALRERDRMEQEKAAQLMRQQVSDNDVANAVKATGKSKASHAALGQHLEDRTVKAFGEMSKSAVDTAGAFKSVAGMVGMFGAAVQTTIMLTRDASTVLMQISRQNINKESIIGAWQANIPAMHAQQQSRAAHALVDVDASSRYLRQLPERRRFESAFRGLESVNEYTDAQKAFYRQRSETFNAQYERVDAINESLAFHGKKKSGLEQSITTNGQAIAAIKANYEKEDKRKADEQVKIHQKQLVPGVGLLKSEQQRIEEIGVQRQKEKEDAAKRIKEAMESQLSAQQDINSLQEKDNQLLAEKHSITREMQQDAYNQLRDEKQAVRKTSMGFGALDHGTIERLKHLQNKTDWIKSQQDDNIAAGRNKNFGVEQLEKHEIQEGLQHGIGGEVLEEQAQIQGEATGLRGREHNKDTLDERQRRFDEVNKFVGPTEGKTEADLGAAVDKTKENSKRIVDAMTGVFAQEALVKQLESDLAVIKQTFQTQEVKRGSIFSFFIGGGV